ncbi:GAF domain-containing protein [Sphingomonas sp. MG17]|uniref:GAF domain-containing protein n=1 Tax=Sphingomonas tagetis TaxID=2949092 RepID=A0A9X2HSF0_9SPHN|nr:GAF domain-containing protein [Sphingomonas tagetis]MCP3731040.1 GAF domain-containing protein [Sphingomonas tagetis]
MTRNVADHAGVVLGAVASPSSAGRSALVASWCRSALHHGLDPTDRAVRPRLNQRGIEVLRESHDGLLAVARPVLDDVFRNVGRTGCGVVLSDRNGTILERRVCAGDADDFERVGLVEGASWSEAQEGTNGIGTCLVENRPLVIHRDQHFAGRNIGMSCMDAPVHDEQGQLIAALDVSSCRADHGPAMSEMIGALVRDAARRIERDYFCRGFDGARFVFLADDMVRGSALLAVDRDDLVIGASRAARIRLGLDDAALSRPRPVAQLLGSGADTSFEDAERAVLRRALAQTDGNASRAARQLGIGRATLYRRMARAGVTD